ncbi:Phage head-tail adapter protein [Bacillus sp. 349Y]|nr:Phage head-tail adapter protein [Bacillus sp. 349Y]
MIKYEHRGVKIKSGDLRTPISFYEFAPTEGPEPGNEEVKTLYECWAKVEKVWLKDLEQAKANGTLEDLTVRIRDPRGSFVPLNNQYIGINEVGYLGKRYRVYSIQPDSKNVGFIVVIAEMVT